MRRVHDCPFYVRIKTDLPFEIMERRGVKSIIFEIRWVSWKVFSWSTYYLKRTNRIRMGEFQCNVNFRVRVHLQIILIIPKQIKGPITKKIKSQKKSSLTIKRFHDDRKVPWRLKCPMTPVFEWQCSKMSETPQYYGTIYFLGLFFIFMGPFFLHGTFLL